VARYFLDSSALAKRYVAEPGSAWVKALTDASAGNQCWIASVTRVETLAAIFRRVRTKTLSLGQAHQIEGVFRVDLTTRFRSIPADAAVLDEAMRLVAIHPLRAYDAIQLAIAMALKAQNLVVGAAEPTFISADKILNRAAAAEGLTTDDPNLHP
jgi:predicted nucleic acid-binding protein